MATGAPAGPQGHLRGHRGTCVGTGAPAGPQGDVYSLPQGQAIVTFAGSFHFFTVSMYKLVQGYIETSS